MMLHVAVLRRLAALGPERVDELLRADTVRPAYVIEFQESDLGDLRVVSCEKECKYQQPKDGDLFCSVGFDPTKFVPPVSDLGATTRFMCNLCSLPDARVVCSHLHHATVLMLPDGVPQAKSARCDIGNAQAQQEPAKCRPGGHECWTRIVEFPRRASPVGSPLALHESFDYFDALWNNVFKAHVLRMRSAAVLGKMATPCASQADFEVKLSALADIINLLEVRDDDLSPEHRESENHKKGRTLARVESALARGATDAGMEAGVLERVKAAVTVLRNAMDLRRGYQHTGDASGKLPQAFSRFGLAFPPSSGEVAWQRVQEGVLGALAELRDMLRDLD